MHYIKIIESKQWPSIVIFFVTGLSNISKRIEKMAETSLHKKASELKLILESTSDDTIVLDVKFNFTLSIGVACFEPMLETKEKANL